MLPSGRDQILAGMEEDDDEDDKGHKDGPRVFWDGHDGEGDLGRLIQIHPRI